MAKKLPEKQINVVCKTQKEQLFLICENDDKRFIAFLPERNCVRNSKHVLLPLYWKYFNTSVMSRGKVNEEIRYPLCEWYHRMCKNFLKCSYNSWWKRYFSKSASHTDAYKFNSWNVKNTLRLSLVYELHLMISKEVNSSGAKQKFQLTEYIFVTKNKTLSVSLVWSKSLCVSLWTISVFCNVIQLPVNK